MNYYKYYRQTVDTGDIFLFSGTGIIPTVIKLITKSIYSHVGIAIRIDKWDVNLLLESTTLNTEKDVTFGRKVRGVSVVPLSSRIEEYRGKVITRKLCTKLDEDQLNILRNFKLFHEGVPYEKNKLSMLKAVLTCVGNKSDLSSLFCSELVAEALKEMGLIDGNPSNYIPSDFSSETRFPVINKIYEMESLIKC